MATATGVDYDAAAAALGQAGGHVKTAIVMLKAGVDASAARAGISAAEGFVREAIGGATRPA